MSKADELFKSLGYEKDLHIDQLQKEIERLKKDNKELDKECQALFEAYNFNNTNLLAKTLKEYRKEIENLKKPRYLYNAHTGEITKLENSNCISKDKIREKIEELEKQDKESKLSHNYLVIPVLKSLLEEE